MISLFIPFSNKSGMFRANIIFTMPVDDLAHH